MIRMKKIIESKYKEYLQDIKEWSELEEQFEFNIHDVYEVDKKKVINLYKHSEMILVRLIS